MENCDGPSKDFSNEAVAHWLTCMAIQLDDPSSNPDNFGCFSAKLRKTYKPLLWKKQNQSLKSLLFY